MKVKRSESEDLTLSVPQEVLMGLDCDYGLDGRSKYLLIGELSALMQFYQAILFSL